MAKTCVQMDSNSLSKMMSLWKTMKMLSIMAIMAHLGEAKIVRDRTRTSSPKR